ncbi:MAG: LVIVD repeat-containing protein [Promethearchaeota archaeon]
MKFYTKRLNIILVIGFLMVLLIPLNIKPKLEDKNKLQTAYIDVYEPTSSTTWNICDDQEETIRWDGWEGSGVDLYLYRGETKVKWLGFYKKGVSNAKVWIDNSVNPGSNYRIKVQDVGWDMDVGWSDTFTITCSGGGGHTEDDLTGEAEATGYSSGANCHDIEISGTYAFIADSTEGLVVIDVSDPLNPDTDNPIYEPLEGYTTELVVVDDYAFFACGGGSTGYEFKGLAIVDISNPNDPSTPIKITTDGDASDIYIDDNFAYLTLQTYWNSTLNDDDGQQALAIIDISDPTNPGDPIYVPLLGYTYDVKVSQGYAYIGCMDEGVAIVDVSNPTSPGVPSYILSDSERLRYLSIYGDILYAAEITYPGELFIYNISNPSSPQLLDSIQDIRCSNDFLVVEDILYYSRSTYLDIVDIGDPNNVIELETKTTNGIAEGFCISGTYAYVADNGGGIKIFSINHLYEDKIAPDESDGSDEPEISSYHILILIMGLLLGIIITVKTRFNRKFKSI